VLRAVAVAAAAATWLAACDNREASSAEGSGNSGAPAPSYVDPAAAMVQQRVLHILALSETSTVELREPRENGTVHVHRVRKPVELSPKRRSWFPDPAVNAPTPGTVLRGYDLANAPTLLLVDDAGTIVLVLDEKVVGVRPDGTEFPIAEGDVGSMQWDDDGNRLLLSGPGIKRVLAWPSLEVAADFSSREMRGRLVFAPEGAGYWLLEERVDFDASQPMRILWTTSAFDGVSDPTPLAQMHPVAFVGTCPQNGLVWTVAVEKHRIVPEAGSLREADAQLASLRDLTSAGDSLDFAPVADRGDRLFFLRAPRLVDGAMRRTARAWMRDLKGDAPERQITIEPTFAVAVSPSGERMALVVLRDGTAAIVASETATVLSVELSAPTALRRDFEATVEGFLDDLRAAYQQAVPEGPPPIADNPADQIPWPTEPMLDAMADALAASLKTRLGIEADGTLASLGAIDDLLTEADGLIPEQEATILAFAGYEGRVLRREGGAEWLLESASPALGIDTDAVTTGDDLLMSFHNSFYAAREALAGRLAFDPVARELLAEWRRPIALVENPSFATESLWKARRLEQAAVKTDGDPVAALRDAATRAVDNNIVSHAAIEVATKAEDNALRLLAALNLAETCPDSPLALLEAADAVQPLGVPELRVALCDQAERIDPENPRVLAEHASALFAAGRYDEAEERFRRIPTVEGGSMYKQLVDEALFDIEGRRREAGQ